MPPWLPAVVVRQKTAAIPTEGPRGKQNRKGLKKWLAVEGDVCNLDAISRHLLRNISSRFGRGKPNSENYIVLLCPL